MELVRTFLRTKVYRFLSLLVVDDVICRRHRYEMTPERERVNRIIFYTYASYGFTGAFLRPDSCDRWEI